MTMLDALTAKPAGLNQPARVLHNALKVAVCTSVAWFTLQYWDALGAAGQAAAAR